MKELIRAESLAKFKQYILYELNFLAEHERIYVPRIDPEKFNLRQQEIAEAYGATIRADRIIKQEAAHHNLTRSDEDYKVWGIKLME